MKTYSTREAAKRLGIHLVTLQEYIAAKKISAPPVKRLGGVRLRLWTGTEIERVREILPKIANGRKTRYSKKRSAVSAQQSVKTRKKKKK